MDDCLFNVKLGAVWLKWMNFGPSYASRAAAPSTISSATTCPSRSSWASWRWRWQSLIGMPLGIHGAFKQNTFWDYLG